jgi:hypothetical protein
VEFKVGEIEHLPLPDESADVIINAFREAPYVRPVDTLNLRYEV